MEANTVTITDASHLTDAELAYEYSLRELNMNSVAPTMRAANLTAFLVTDRDKGADLIERWRMKEEDFDQTEFDQFVAATNTATEEIQRHYIVNANADREAAVNRLSHYYLRLHRYPASKTEQLGDLLGKIELVMLMVNQLSHGTSATPLTTDASAPEHDSNANGHSSTMHSSTLNPGMTEASEGVPLADSNLQQDGTTTTTVTGANSTAQSARSVYDTGYVPSREDISIYASAPTPSMPFGPPSDSLREGYVTRQRLASTRMNNLGQTTYIQTTNINPATGRSAIPIVSNIEPHTQRTEPQREAQAQARLPGSDLRSLKQFLSNRYFDGSVIDKTHMGAEDFILSLSMFARSAPGAESTIINNMASLLSGKALVWWSNEVNNITTFGEFTQSLRCRFATYTSDRHGMIAAIYDRKQKKNEPLSDFVDTMLSMMAQVPDVFDADAQVRTITRNADPECRKHLIGRVYRTIRDFTQYVNELAHITNTTTESTRLEKKSHFVSKKVHAIEMVNESEDDSSSDAEDGNRALEVLATAFQKVFGHKARGSAKPDRVGRKQPHEMSHEMQRNKSNCSCAHNQMNAKSSKPGVSCYGCGAPGVYKNECTTCQSKPAAEPSKNATPILSLTASQDNGRN